MSKTDAYLVQIGDGADDIAAQEFSAWPTPH